MTIKALLQLLRPANIVTSVADVWAGAVISCGLSGILFVPDMSWISDFPWASLVWLSASTAFLYGGGVVLNDYFDAELDSVERPERPIPRGDVTRPQAGMLGFALLLAGILLAFPVGTLPGLIAACIAGLVLLYDVGAKVHSVWGPLNMGLCRSANLLLGISILPALAGGMAWLGLFPLVFITAVTVISRGEVMGGNKRALQISLFLYALLAAALIVMGAWQDRLLLTLLFAAGWFAFAVRPLFRALQTLQPREIRLSVKSGVLSLIFLDAAYAAAFAGWLPALSILVLLPVSLVLAKAFAVT